MAIPDTTYRIRLEGAGPSPLTSDAPPRKAPAPQPRATTEEGLVKKSEEAALIPLVDAERDGSRDLLERDAPRE